MESAQWLADYNTQLANTAAAAQAASAELANVSGQASSPRGEVQVRVTAGGALADLHLTPGARKLEAEQLAQLILSTARAAQQRATAQLTEIMTGYLGDSAALDAIKQNAPIGEPALVPAPSDDEYFTAAPGVIQ